MTTKTVYVAADGTIFDREDECWDYETELTGKIITGINFSGEKTGFHDPYFMTEVQIVNLPTKEAVGLFCGVATANKITISGIDEPGIYALGMNIGCEYRWDPIDTVINDYELEIGQLKKYKNMLQR